MPSFQILEALSENTVEIRRVCNLLFRDVERVVELPVTPHFSKYVVLFERVSSRLQTFLDKLENGTCQGIAYADASWQVRLAPFTYCSQTYPDRYAHRIHDLFIQLEFTMLTFTPFTAPQYVNTETPMSVSSSAHVLNVDDFSITEIVDILDSHPNVCVMKNIGPTEPF